MVLFGLAQAESFRTTRSPARGENGQGVPCRWREAPRTPRAVTTLLAGTNTSSGSDKPDRLGQTMVDGRGSSGYSHGAPASMASSTLIRSSASAMTTVGSRLATSENSTPLLWSVKEPKSLKLADNDLGHLLRSSGAEPAFEIGKVDVFAPAGHGEGRSRGTERTELLHRRNPRYAARTRRPLLRGSALRTTAALYRAACGWTRSEAQSLNEVPLRRSHELLFPTSTTRYCA